MNNVYYSILVQIETTLLSLLEIRWNLFSIETLNKTFHGQWIIPFWTLNCADVSLLFVWMYLKFSRMSCKLCITLFHFILWYSYISDTKEAEKTRTNSIVVPYRSQFEPVWSQLLHLRHKIKWSVRSSREIGSSCKYH